MSLVVGLVGKGLLGLGPVPVQFSAGYNVGVRGGYQLGPWRFEEEYSYRRNNVAEYGGRRRHRWGQWQPTHPYYHDQCAL